MSNLIPLELIRAARERDAGTVKKTPLERSDIFSSLCGRDVFLKMENLQKTGSFKVRGALSKIQSLDGESRRRGVITASAGNHAQGVAYAGRILYAPVTVVMPEQASFSKVAATTGYGARVILHGRDYAEAYAKAVEVAEADRLTFVHAFDDRDVIAGQGTLGLELLEQLPDLDTVVVPVGGGGLIAGLASALRGSGSRARIIAVQPEGASSLGPSIRAGSRVELREVQTIADGLATRCVGELPFAVIKNEIDQTLEVSDAQIAEAVLLLLERAKTMVEGAGAAALAACLSRGLPASARHVVVIMSGGNIDMNLLDRIINLGLAQEGRFFRFSTRLADRPGELQRLVACIAACRANIHQIGHERSQPGLALTHASVTLELETRGPTHIAEIRRALAEAGFESF